MDKPTKILTKHYENQRVMLNKVHGALFKKATDKA